MFPKFEILLRWLCKPMSALAIGTCIRFLFSEVDGQLLLVLLILSEAIVCTLSVDVLVGHVLSTKGAHHLVLFQLTGIPIH